MPRKELTIGQLTQELRKAKQRPMHFQFAGGKTDDKHYFDISIKKLPPGGKQLARKKAGNKPMEGTVKVDGKEIIFETKDPIVSKYEILLTKYLRKLKMGGMTVVIRPPGEGGGEDKKT